METGKNMKVLVTGVNGQLGHDVINELNKRGYEGVGSDIATEYVGNLDSMEKTKIPYTQMDITNKLSVQNILLSVLPDVVIHCAAWTAVDMAEDEDNVEKVRAINAGGTRNIAEMCQRLDCKMVYISTDYVFDGEGTKAWEPDCEEYKPVNVYGQTKYEGELAIEEFLDRYFIVRIAWVFGVNGKNFIKTMLNLSKNHERLTVVNDQTGSPTYTFDLARLLVDMAETDKYGRYHATNEGLCTWYEFACEIFKQAGIEIEVVPVGSNEYPAKARRPENSRMNKEKLTQKGFERLPSWQDALARYLKEIGY